MDPSQMMSRSFPMWVPPPAPPSDNLAAPPPFLPPPNRGWKRKNPSSSAAGYQPPALGDLQVQNRAKARRWFKNHNPPGTNRAPNRRHFKAAAPRNTTSYIIRAKRSGGIASLVSPCPVTPAVLPTPRLSPSREGLADMAQAQWGVDGYGSMKGLIRLRSSPHPNAPTSDDDEDDGNSSGSDVEEHVEVERRLDHDLSRFEMVYPAAGEDAGGYVFEDDDDYDQDAHVARLEEENLTLKERLFLMEQEVGDMRRRLEALEVRFLQNDAVGGVRQNDDIHVTSENSGEDNVERVTDVVDSDKELDAGKAAVNSEKQLDAGKASVDSDKELHAGNKEFGAGRASVDSDKEFGAGRASVDSNKEFGAGKASVDSDKEFGAGNAAVDSDKELDAGKAAVYSDKEFGAGKASVDSDKELDARKAAVDPEKMGGHNAENRDEQHDAEMVDAVLEDDAGHNRLEASTRD